MGQITTLDAELERLTKLKKLEDADRLERERRDMWTKKIIAGRHMEDEELMGKDPYDLPLGSFSRMDYLAISNNRIIGRGRTREEAKDKAIIKGFFAPIIWYGNNIYEVKYEEEKLAIEISANANI